MRQDREYIEFKVEQAWGATKPEMYEVRLGMQDTFQMRDIQPDRYISHIQQSLAGVSSARQWGFQFTLHMMGLDEAYKTYIKQKSKK